MREVRINRARWLRGSSEVNSLWDTTYNAGCCLGHVCKQISRKTEEELDGTCRPEEVLQATSLLTDRDDDWGDQMDNELAKKAMSINDAGYSDTKREAKLKELFRKHGVKMTFYGEGDPIDILENSDLSNSDY